MMKQRRPALSILLRYTNHGNKNDVNYSIARIMVENFELISKKTIHEMAELCFVSASSLSRFAKIIGYENYTEFKKSSASTINIDVDYSVEVSRARKEDFEPIFNQYTENIIANLRFLNKTLDFERINYVTNLIHNSDKIVFLGLEFATLIGHHFQIKMGELDKHVEIGETYEEQLEIVNNLTSNCLVIIASLEGGYFYRNHDIIKIIEKNKTQSIVLTMNKHIKPLQHLDGEILIINENNSNTEGRVSLLFAIEMIIMLYYINFKDI